jgi:hypothetical protein
MLVETDNVNQLNNLLYEIKLLPGGHTVFPRA